MVVSKGHSGFLQTQQLYDFCAQVVLIGTAPFLHQLRKPLTPIRNAQLARIKHFFNIQVVKTYTDSSGSKRCAGAQDKLNSNMFFGGENFI